MPYHIKKTRRFFLCFVLFFSTLSLFGQNSNPVWGKAVYVVSQGIEGTNLPHSVSDGELVFDENKSVFTYAKKIMPKGEVNKSNKAGNEIMIFKGSPGKTDPVGLVFYSDFAEGKTVQRGVILGRSFIISDTLRTVDWIVLDESREIGGMKCQKAKASVHGREYEAWFSGEIPLPYGPWKLQGLPGLILEARSTDGSVSFEFKEIQPALGEEQKIAPPAKGQKIEGYANFHALQDRKTEEYSKSVSAALAEHKSAHLSSDSRVMTAVNVRRIEKTPAF